jgi:hypothetical protein
LMEGVKRWFVDIIFFFGFLEKETMIEERCGGCLSF